jgi:CII-binding regulator of phage lambda lysogenization HflD
MQSQLTDLQITKIEQFCKDEEMFNAVRAVLLAGIYTHGTLQKGFTPDPLINGALSLVHLSSANPVPDEVLGQHIRGVWEGLNALQNAIQNLKNIKSDIKSPYIEINEAV